MLEISRGRKAGQRPIASPKVGWVILTHGLAPLHLARRVRMIRPMTVEFDLETAAIPEFFPSGFQGWTRRNGFLLVRVPLFPNARVVELVDTHV